ncbi:MAG: hypothetical protein ACLQNE_12635 [Thermoguttaceae bacterium]
MKYSIQPLQAIGLASPANPRCIAIRAVAVVTVCAALCGMAAAQDVSAPDGPQSEGAAQTQSQRDNLNALDYATQRGSATRLYLGPIQRTYRGDQIETCVSAGPVGVCRTSPIVGSGGASWDVQVGGDAVVPGAAASLSASPITGRTSVCAGAGPVVGLGDLAIGGAQMYCAEFDPARFQEAQRLQAWARQSAPGDSLPQQMEQAQQDQAAQQYLDSLGNLSAADRAQAYRDYQAARLDEMLPADNGASDDGTATYDDNMPRSASIYVPRTRPITDSGMTAAQLRAQINQNVQSINQAYEQRMSELQQSRRAALAAAAGPAARQSDNNTGSAFSPRIVFGDRKLRATPGASDSGRLTYDENQPRRTNSAGTQAASSGRANQVYYGDGTSRPIGQGSNVVSVRQRADNNTVANSSDNRRITFDDNQPRQNQVYYGDGTSRPIGQGSNVVSVRQRADSNSNGSYGGTARVSYDASQPRSTPSVSTPSVNMPSVSLPAVSTRQTGVASRTAALVMP